MATSLPQQPLAPKKCSAHLQQLALAHVWARLIIPALMCLSVCLCCSQEKRHHITAELGYSQTWWRKYDFYFAFCEAAFDVRYIHDFHVTWVKGQQQEHTGLVAGAQPAAAAAVSTVVAAAEAGAGWVKQELPTDSFTQVRATGGGKLSHFRTCFPHAKLCCCICIGVRARIFERGSLPCD
jgi:hypothetical protein